MWYIYTVYLTVYPCTKCPLHAARTPHHILTPVHYIPPSPPNNYNPPRSRPPQPPSTTNTTATLRGMPSTKSGMGRTDQRGSTSSLSSCLMRVSTTVKWSRGSELTPEYRSLSPTTLSWALKQTSPSTCLTYQLSRHIILKLAII